MKHCFSFLVIICLSFPALSQTVTRQSTTTVPSKQVIDSAAIANWYDLGRSDVSITADGKYFMYRIFNFPAGKQTLVVQSTGGAWKKEFVGAKAGVFSFDSKYAIFQSADSLFFLTLGKNRHEQVTGVSFYTYPQRQSKESDYNYGKLIAYKLKQNNILILRDLTSGKELTIENVVDFAFNKKGTALLIKRQNKVQTVETLEWMDVGSKQTKQVWSNNNNPNITIGSYAFDEAGTQVVFSTQDKNYEWVNTVWYYKQGMPKAEVKVSNELLHRTDSMLISSSPPSFSKNGKYIFFELQRQPEVSPSLDPKAVQVDVWNHKDLLLQPLQQYFNNTKQDIFQLLIKNKFASVINIETGEVRHLENDTTALAPGNWDCGDYVMTASYQNTGDKSSWYRYQNVTYYLTALADGKQKRLTVGAGRNFGINYYLSPDRRILVYFDARSLMYMSYDLERRIIRNISGTIPVKLTEDNVEEYYFPNFLPAGIAAWLDNGNLLIRDNYDLWMLDPAGKQAPENITNGYGRADNIKFDVIPSEGRADENAILPLNKPLLLTGFGEYTKQNGFFKVDFNKKNSDPELLSMHPYLMYASSRLTSCHNSYSDTKAKAANADKWIIKKQSVSDAPNIYLTHDFKKFKRLTDIEPQKKYQWMTDELITWKTADGKVCQGVLYKPEDFDSTKKYPVIVFYYQKLSGMLHQFLTPELSNGALDIPWFVSRGYLVFTPDIHYTVNNVAKNVVNSVMPGVQQLLKLPFVDSSAIGIQGHSFGGYETNVLITETNLFAAAAEGAGRSNHISGYGSLLPAEGNDGAGFFHLERGGQYRMNGPLWGNEQAYFENSPIFKADKVTTPLLIMHNKGDEAVPWGQAVELFIALRRLEKRVWMLQYDKGGHGVRGIRDKMDFTTRMTQFFDHYLKGAPAPGWMTKCIPAARKGVVTGYELDPAGSCALDGINACKGCKQWNEQYRRTPEMFSKAETEWHLDKDLKIIGK